MAPDDDAQYLAGSADRRQLLAHLRDAPAAPAELTDALPMARRTVQRHLGAFVDRGWAEKTDGAYRLTVTGELVIDEHLAYLEALDRIDACDALFAHLPDRDHAPDPQWLTDATVTSATAADPQAPVQQYLRTVRDFETDRVRMLSPVLSRLFHNAHAELALDGVHTELVLSTELVDRAQDLNPAEFAVVTRVGVLDLYRHPGPVPVGLTLGDDRLVLAAYDDDRQLQACVESTHPAFVAWGTQLFDRYRDRATLVGSPGPRPFDGLF